MSIEISRIIYLNPDDPIITLLYISKPYLACMETYNLPQVMVAESYDILRETYLAIVMDRTFAGPVIVASPKGGMDIEEVARENPHFIFKVK